MTHLGTTYYGVFRSDDFMNSWIQEVDKWPMGLLDSFFTVLSSRKDPKKFMVGASGTMFQFSDGAPAGSRALVMSA